MVLLNAAVLSAGCFYLRLFNVNTFSYAAGIFTPMLLNALVGVVTDGSQIYTVSTPQKRIDVTNSSGEKKYA